jgi:hypothetical protein
VPRPVTVAAVLLATLILGAAASPAAEGARELKLTGGPVSLGRLAPFPGYQMIVVASPHQNTTSVGVELLRTERGGIQEQIYSFELARGALRVSHDLAAATLDTGSGLGRFGRIRMTYSRGHHTLAGVFDLRTDVGVRLRERSLPAKLAYRPVPKPTRHPGVNIGDGKPTVGSTGSCNQDPGTAALTLIGSTGVGFAAGRPPSGPAILAAWVQRRRVPAQEFAVIESPGPRSALSFDGLKTARIDAAHVPFLSGQLDFSHTGSIPGCPGTGAIGTATGSLRARFDFFGTVRALTTSRAPGALLIEEPL